MTDGHKHIDGWRDQFLGEELSPAENNPEKALFHIHSCGLEKTVSYGGGTAKGPKAIIAASHQLERLIDGEVPCKRGIYTPPPINCTNNIEDCLAELRGAVCQSAQAGHIPITLGGEHSLTYGAVMGVKDAIREPIGIIQIDAHADLRQAYQGQRHSHASVMNVLVEEGFALFQLGVRALCEEEVERRLHYSVGHIDAAHLIRHHISAIALPDDFPKNLYISFDLDGLDPSILPATGTPVPGGLGFYQAIDLLASATKGRTIIGADIVELAPCHHHPASDFTAALMCYHLMRLAVLRK